MGDSNPLATFGYVARELGRRKIAFICAREALGEDRIGPELKRPLAVCMWRTNDSRWRRRMKYWPKVRLTRSPSVRHLSPTRICPRRLRDGSAVECAGCLTFYAPGEKGYTDYPALQEHEAIA